MNHPTDPHRDSIIQGRFRPIHAVNGGRRRDTVIAVGKVAGVIVFLVFAGCGLLAGSAAAETVWVHPDRDPFRGTLDEALGLFAAKGIPRQVLAEQRRMYAAGRCTRRRISDGERIDLMTFGKDEVLSAVVAATRSWPDGTPRGAVICRAAAAPGTEYALLRPDVCGNWSEEKLPAHPAASAPASPAALDEPRAIAGILPAAAPGFEAGGSGEFLEPAGFVLSPIPPDVPAGDLAPAPSFEAGGSGGFPNPAAFVIPTVVPDLPVRDFSPRRVPGPVPPASPGPPAAPHPPPPPASVPEPASGVLLGSALAVLALVKRASRS
jgi:hypothetical protein